MSEFAPSPEQNMEDSAGTPQETEYPSFDEREPIAETSIEATSGPAPEVELEPTDVAPNDRQQRKILTYFMGPENMIMNSSRKVFNPHEIITSSAEDPIEEFNMDPLQISVTKNKLKDGEITAEQKSSFLAMINPKNTPEDLTTIKHDSLLRGIFATAEWGDFRIRDDPTVWGNDKLIESFQQKYPTPIEYEPFIQKFLDGIEKNNDSAKRAKYEQASKQLRDLVYGKRNEYYDQIRLIAEELPPETKRTSPTETPENS